MKQFCVFMSFVVVNVLADKLADYTKEVAFTNRQIELINSRSDVYLREVIKEVICGTTSMEKISIMVAVPDMVIDENGEIIEMKQQLTIDEDNYSSNERLKRLFFASMENLRAAFDRLRTDVGTSDAGNKGVDDSDVKDEGVDDSDVKDGGIDDSDVEDEGIDDSDVKDGDIENPEVQDESIDDTDVKGKSIDDSDVNDKILKIDEKDENSEESLQQYIDFQIELQNLITTVLGIDDSDDKDENIEESDVIEENIDNPDVKSETSFFASMKNLRAEFDRFYTVVGTSDAGNKDEACRKKLSELGIERRGLLYRVVQVLLGIKDFDVKGKSVVDTFMRGDLCRLRGLYRSVLYPQTFVIKAEVDGYECYLTGIDNITYTR